jgi:hypothetical protein
MPALRATDYLAAQRPTIHTTIQANTLTAAGV